jgi:hypothetical protein
VQVPPGPSNPLSRRGRRQANMKRRKQKSTKQTEVSRAAPPNNNTDATVTEGRAAWNRRKNETGTWEDWVLIGKALAVGKQEALARANKARAVGSKYNKSFSEWLQIHGFDDIDKADRAKLLQIIDKLEEVDEWRANLTEGQ